MKMQPLRLTALGGVVLVALVARDASLPALVLMLAAGVIVPLGLALAAPPRWLVWLAPFGAAGGVLSWAFAPGSVAAIAGAALHALTCAAAGIFALQLALPFARERTLPPLPDIASLVGLAFLPPAAVWLLASRAGVPLAGFHEPVVTFTAAHFHVAGFAAPTILGALGQRLEKHDLVYRAGTVAVGAGVPLTALGIATNHTIEQLSAILVATGMLAASATLLRFRAPWPTRVLFIVSGATLLLTMTLAATFALTSSAGRSSSLNGAPGAPGLGAGAVEVETMIRYHGAANAIFFAIAALLALNLTPPRLRSSR